MLLAMKNNQNISPHMFYNDIPNIWLDTKYSDLKTFQIKI